MKINPFAGPSPLYDAGYLSKSADHPISPFGFFLHQPHT
jgi:hypothetical protein